MTGKSRIDKKQKCKVSGPYEKPDKQKRGITGVDERNGAQQFYTSPSMIKRAVEISIDTICDTSGISTYFDPSAGNGAFGAGLAKAWKSSTGSELTLIQSDIAPTDLSVAEGDFLNVDTRASITDKLQKQTKNAYSVETGLILGGFNPPYGYRSSMAIAFVDAMAPICDYVVMLVPPVIVLHLRKFYRELHLSPIPYSNKTFYNVLTNKPFAYTSMLFIGVRLEGPSTPEPELKGLVSGSIVTDADRIPVNTVLLMRSNGGTSGRSVFVRALQEEQTGTRIWVQNTRGTVLPASAGFNGMLIQNKNWMAFKPTKLLETMQAGRVVDWQDVAARIMNVPLPFLVKYSDHQHMRKRDDDLMVETALLAHLSEHADTIQST